MLLSGNPTVFLWSTWSPILCNNYLKSLFSSFFTIWRWPCWLHRNLKASDQMESSSAFHYQTYKPIYTCPNFLLSLSFILDVPSPMVSSCQCFRNHPLSLSLEYYTHVLLYFLLLIQSSLLLYISNYHSFSSHPYMYIPHWLLGLASHFPELQLCIKRAW